MMPTDPKDDQQIQKKKHIANDVIRIVYCESSRDYRPGVISSQFNFVHFMLKPLRNGKFYQVKIPKLDEIAFFGPLFTGMVVSAEVLPSLLRQTIINAHKECVSLDQLKTKRTFLSRSENLRQKITKKKAHLKLGVQSDDPASKRAALNFQSLIGAF